MKFGKNQEGYRNPETLDAHVLLCSGSSLLGDGWWGGDVTKYMAYDLTYSGRHKIHSINRECEEVMLTCGRVVCSDSSVSEPSSKLPFPMPETEEILARVAHERALHDARAAQKEAKIAEEEAAELERRKAPIRAFLKSEVFAVVFGIGLLMVISAVFPPAGIGITIILALIYGGPRLFGNYGRYDGDEGSQ